MEKSFMFGLAIGMLTGALLVANSRKARQFVTEGQDKALEQMEELTQKAKAQTKKPSAKKSAKTDTAN